MKTVLQFLFTCHLENFNSSNFIHSKDVGYHLGACVFVLGASVITVVNLISKFYLYGVYTLVEAGELKNIFEMI